MNGLKSLRTVAAAGVVMIALAACGGGDSGDSGDSGTPSGPVDLGYMGWVPKAEEAVALWNEANPDEKVTYTPVANGQEAYPKIRSSVQAGNAGCLAQLTYDQVPSFVADGMLMDVTAYTGDIKDSYLDWTWSQVSPGGKTYAIPQDTGPMGLFYRKDLFEKYDIEVPTTWDEFAAAAKKVREADPDAT